MWTTPSYALRPARRVLPALTLCLVLFGGAREALALWRARRRAR